MSRLRLNIIYLSRCLLQTKPQNTALGVVYDEGRRCCMKGAADISGLEKISQQEMETILNDFDPIEVLAPYFLSFFSFFVMHQ